RAGRDPDALRRPGAVQRRSARGGLRRGGGGAGGEAGAQQRMEAAAGGAGAENFPARLRTRTAVSDQQPISALNVIFSGRPECMVHTPQVNTKLCGSVFTPSTSSAVTWNSNGGSGGYPGGAPSQSHGKVKGESTSSSIVISWWLQTGPQLCCATVT